MSFSCVVGSFRRDVVAAAVDMKGDGVKAGSRAESRRIRNRCIHHTLPHAANHNGGATQCNPQQAAMIAGGRQRLPPRDTPLKPDHLRPTVGPQGAGPQRGYDENIARLQHALDAHIEAG